MSLSGIFHCYGQADIDITKTRNIRLMRHFQAEQVKSGGDSIIVFFRNTTPHCSTMKRTGT